MGDMIDRDAVLAVADEVFDLFEKKGDTARAFAAAEIGERIRALPAAAPAEPNAMESLVADAARAARNVFADYGSKAREAIDYMEQHILAELRRSE